ncbi:prolyl 4-hydroxylase subunit alpha-1-like [Solea solea]|uniref:prolyl 4-hydroxylase subunit alpha-1-like n=1 Tax=Solea solea TaxID=90069 RepID=UPI00272D5DC6|nr:prolyl 4-hydroxylase subunit alpha-1-like [Solea solea]
MASWCWSSLVLCLLLTSSSAHDDFFTSISKMTDLLFTEKDLLTSLKNYIQAEEKKLEQIKTWADKLDVLSAAATQDPEGFLGHPVNAFKLIKRLNTEWAELESLVLSDMSDVFVSNLTVHRQNFPDSDDETGAAKALMRLQDTYQLDTDAIATGQLPGSSSNRGSLTVSDCFDIGRVAYSEDDYYHMQLWMIQALKQLDQGETSSSVDAITVLDYLSYSLYQQGELERALQLTKRLLELDPTDEQATKNQKYYEHQLSNQKGAEEGVEEGAESARRPKGVTHNVPDDFLPVMWSYEELCRGEGVSMTPRRQIRLFCRYYDNNRHPRYVIGPVKQEVEWDRPLIVRYHDIVSDKDMETVKELAKPRLQRAGVHEAKSVDYRISKNAWLREHEHPVVDKINQRIEDITGLDMSTAEYLQVANYGVGGQYEPHYDFGPEDKSEEFGRRIATWLLYMSDVQAGGATVFTDVRAAVKPIKGTAVFWYNLYASGEGDGRTRHAACPVLVGSKWVSNKWIHERGQEFRRRCGLRKTD